MENVPGFAVAFFEGLLQIHWELCCFPFFFYCNSHKGVPELVLKDQKDIALEITVTNSPSNPKNPTKDGDDAHEAKLIATFPDTLTYSAYRELRAFPVSILRDQLGGGKKNNIAW